MCIRIIRYIVLLGLLVVFTSMAKSVAPTPPNVIIDKPIHITLSGISETDILDNTQKMLKITTAAHLVKPITQDSILNIYHNTPENIRKAMQPYGYFNPHTSSHYHRKRGQWYMHFTIYPGKRSIVTRINIKIIGQGTAHSEIMRLVRSYPLKRGDYFTLNKYSDGNNALMINAATYGYFGAKIADKHIHVNLANNTVQIKIVFDTGPRYRFGATTFSNTPFNQHFLNKFVAFKQGDYYDSKYVNRTQNNFASSMYFTQVAVTPEVNQAVNHMTPMHVTLHMRKRKVYQFGLGYNTDTQLRGLVGFKYRWVNAWGHYINARAEGSFVDYNISAGYHIPWPNPMKDLITFRGAMGRLDIRRGKSQSYLLAALYQHQYGNWEQTLSLNYLNERYNMYKLPRTRANLVYPEALLTYYSTKNHMNPDNGLRLTADVSGTPAALSSTSGFGRVQLGGKAIVTLFHYEQLVGRLSYGRIHINDINNLPLSLQFLIGGSQTVRGYSYQSIGPGRNMLYGTIEFRQRIWKDLFIAGFYDFGNVTDERIFGNIRDSAGPSILYRSPVGNIQFSLPWRLAAHHVRPRFVFSIGPEL